MVSSTVFASSKYDRWIDFYAKKYDIPAFVIHSVIKAESSFVEEAIGDRTQPEMSFGLMQLKPSTAKFMKCHSSIKSLLTARNNIGCGTRYLAHLLDELKDLNTALDAYNRGIDNVLKHPWTKPWKKHKYVGKLKRFWERNK
jgi:soluble lytic murein transglycosylase-like protein